MIPNQRYVVKTDGKRFKRLFLTPQQPVNLDDLFDDSYYSTLGDLAEIPNSGEWSDEPLADMIPSAVPDAVESTSKRSASQAKLDSSDNKDDLTEEEKVARRERNREHAKRSRLRKKFLLESLQEQVQSLEEQLEGFKACLRKELPGQAQELIKSVCGDQEKYKPLPMPSGFGPVKTLMEPDFRLST